MQSFVRKLFLISALLLVALSGFAQGTTGALTGTVMHNDAALPGATVTVSSPSLQGTRTTVTNESGMYNFGALPPGDYTVTFEMSGMQTSTARVRVGLAQTARADARLNLSSVTEAITVTATSTPVAETTEVQTNFDADLIEDLPVARTLVGTTALAPGVVNGVNGLAISGANSYDNLWTVNGAVVNEGIRGQPHNLFIEDAIQETTIQTAGVSAEFGNFTGGVINAITKSGGNEFSGSFRDSLTNPSWTADSQFRNPTTGAAPPDPLDQLNETYEGTLGGRIIRDRLWFFLAGRHAETAFERSFSNSERTYINTITDERLEVKLTGSINQSHTLVGSYLEAPVAEANNCQIGCFDISTVNPSRSLPNDFKSAQYNGMFGPNALLEARYSEKKYAFVNSGGLDKDRVTGTPVRLVAPGFATVTNEPYFCGSCGPEARDNRNIALKGTYYLSTGLGTHNLVAGVEQFHETRLANNYQSPTDYVGFFRTFAPTRDASGNTLISVGNNDILVYFPISQLSLGSDINNNGAFINDRWDVNDNLTLQLGVRYDVNDSKDSAGNVTADDAKFSPRLGLSYDVFGNSRLRFNASYGVYVNRLSEGVSAAGSAAGNASTYQYLYGGTPITNLPPEEAMRQVFTWLDSVGGTQALNNLPCSATRTTGCLLAQSVPGFNSRLEGTLVSPSVNEYSFGVGGSVGRAGYVRADYINRDWNDFYTTKANLGIGAVTSPTGARADLFLTTNSNDFERTYEAIEVQGHYRLFNRIGLGANYTWSELQGNFIGETTGNGPVSVGGNEFYPEYYGFAQNNPIGLLTQDQTHKARAWASVDFPTFLGNFNLSALHRFDSGTPYSLAGTINPTFNANFYGTGRPGGIVNPGYVSAQTAVGYFFSERGEFRFDDQHATDLALNYATNPGWLWGAELFIQGELLNVFDNQPGTFDTSILTAANNAASCTANPTGTGCLQRFNPYTDTPVEGVHWVKGPNFGKPTVATQLQNPRTYRASVGVRF